MDAAYYLARNVVTTRYEDIPSDAVETTKRDVLDTIGVALAGSSAPGIKPLVELIKEWGGKEESTIISYGGRVPALNAAQVNASMSHALDYDDTHEPGVLHTAVAVVPTAIAMAERQGGVSGKEFITAVALGIDLSARMGMATKLRNPKIIHGGWHTTPLYGYFSATATAGKLLGLDEDKMVNALGIAYHQAAGANLCVYDGALTKRMGPGFAARSGILAALMAERGITGSKNSLEAPDLGLYDLYNAGCDRDKLLGDLGKRFEGVNVSMKPYPCCRGHQYYIDVILELVNDNDIKPDEVEEIIVTIHPHLELLYVPQEIKRNPRNIVDCQFSTPWALACAVVRRKAGLTEFTEASMKDPAIRQVAQKVNHVIDNGLPDPFTPALVSIRTRHGVFSKKGGAPLGSPQNPLSMEALVDKFTECATWGLKRLPKHSIDKIVDMISNLENQSDVNQISQMLG